MNYIMPHGGPGRVTAELFGGEPELWESLESDIIQSYSTKLFDNWHRTDYDHSIWFFGTGDIPQGLT